MIPNLLGSTVEKDMAMRAVTVCVQFQNDGHDGEVLVSVPYALMKGGRRTRLSIQMFDMQKVEALDEIP